MRCRKERDDPPSRSKPISRMSLVSCFFASSGSGACSSCFFFWPASDFGAGAANTTASARANSIAILDFINLLPCPVEVLIRSARPHSLILHRDPFQVNRDAGTLHDLIGGLLIAHVGHHAGH